MATAPAGTERADRSAKQRKARDQRAQEFFTQGLESYKAAVGAEDFASAARQFSFAIEWTADNPRLYFARGNCLRMMGAFSKAFDDYSAAIHLDDSAAIFFGNRGVCARQMGKLRQAVADYSRALALDPGNGSFLFNRALAHYEAGAIDDAIDDYTLSMRDKAHAFRALYNRGNCFRATGRLEAALHDLKQAVQLMPTSANVRNALGMTLFALRENAEAVQQFSEAIELRPGEAKFLNNRGLVHFHDGAYARAAKDFEEALELSPSDAELHCNLGNARLAHGELEPALNDLRRAVKLSPSEPRFYHSLGVALQEAQQHQAARRAFDKALELDPDHVASLYHRGLMLARGKRFEEALAAFSDVIARAPGDRLVFEARGLVYRDAELYDLAIKDFDSAIALDPSQGEAHLHRAICYQRVSQFKMAVTDCDAAIRRGLQTEHVFSCKAAALRGLGCHGEALEALTTALELASDSTRIECLFERAQCFMDLEQHERAQRDLEAALDAEPNCLRFLHLCGVACQRQGKFDEALQQYAQALAHLELPTPLSLRFALPDPALELELPAECTDDLVASGDPLALPMPEHAAANEVSELMDRARAATGVAAGAETGDGSSSGWDVKGDEAKEGSESERGEDAEAADSKLDSPVTGAPPRLNEVKEDNERTWSGMMTEVEDQAAMEEDGQAAELDRMTGSIAQGGLRQLSSASVTGARGLPDVILRSAQSLGLTRAALTSSFEALPDLYYASGICLASMDRNMEAVPCFSAAIVCHHARSWQQLLRDQLRARFARRQKTIQRLAGKAVTDASVRIEAGSQARRAIEASDELTIRVSYSEAYVHERAKALQLMGRRGDAVRDFDVVTARNPRNAHAFFRRAFAHKALRDYDASAADFETAKELQPENQLLMVNYLRLHDTECIVIVPPGEEPEWSDGGGWGGGVG